MYICIYIWSSLFWNNHYLLMMIMVSSLNGHIIMMVMAEMCFVAIVGGNNDEDFGCPDELDWMLAFT